MVGNANLILQNPNQANYQQQKSLDAHGVPTTLKIQTSVQGKANKAVAVSGCNIIDQNITQTSVTDQKD